MRLYLGNLPWRITEEDLFMSFEKYGVFDNSIKIIIDRETNKAKGYGFIDVKNGALAIEEMDGKEVQGRILKVSEAQAKNRRY